MFATTLLPLVSFLSPLPAFDEGYDLLILDIPHRIVAGDTLKFAVRGRPNNPYVVFADAQRSRTFINPNVVFHLASSPVMFLPAFGIMPANGANLHRLPVPALPKLDGLKLYMQAIALDAGVIRGVASTDSKEITFHKEQNQPLVALLTVNRITRDLNGSEPGEGVLTTPQTGFTIDLFFNDRGQGAIDTKSLVITADADLASGAIKKGSNLAQFFTFAGNSASGLVGSSWAFPASKIVTIKAKIKNSKGVFSPEESYRFRSDVQTNFNRPFATKQLWHIDFLAHDLDNTGVPDYREDLLLYGLGNDAKAQSGPSFDVFEWARKETQKQLRANYGVGTKDAVNVDFLIKRPTTIHARICIGGRNSFPRNQLPPGAKETTGAAFLNRLNQRKNIIDCFGVVGVHTRSIYHLFKDVPAFKRVFDQLKANPVGNDPDDLVVTKPGFDPTKGTVRQRARYHQIQTGVLTFAKATAFVLTQETSHSMGLVPTGALIGGGLMGAFRYGHSTFGHTEDGLGNYLSGNNSTPAPWTPANNALIWDHWQSGRGHFVALHWAYLRERIINR